MKLIDKAAVVAEIRHLQLCTIDEHMNYYSSKAEAEYNILNELLLRLNILEVKEVDLDFQRFAKEMEFVFSLPSSKTENTEEKPLNWEYAIAKHFYELGLNSQTKDMKEALRMEYEKGRADVLRCIDPDEMVADFCSQPLSKTRSIASVYRQGITDILKRINNNEENSITSTRSIDDCGM